MREEIGHHAAELALEPLHALHLGPEQGAELVGEVYLAPVVILRGADVEAERAGREVELAALQREARPDASRR